jgi:hypothetical protein
VTNTDSVVGVLDIVIRNFATSISILSEDVILLNESDSFFVELQLSNVLFDQK